MTRQCQFCLSTDIVEERGGLACAACGQVVDETNIVSAVEFSESAGGVSAVIGQYVSGTATRSYQSGGPGHGQHRDSREIAVDKAKKVISQLVSNLNMSTNFTEAACRLFTTALARQFTQGRRTELVVGACLYIVARRDGNSPHMLLDFSEELRTNVFVLGSTFLRLTRLLNMQLPLVDPALYLPKYAARLDIAEPERRHDVTNTAVRLVASMSRDWIVKGRRPGSVCGAALLLAARLHGFRVSRAEVTAIVRCNDVTLRNRLAEFENTPTSTLTPDQFASVEVHAEAEPPSFIRGRLAEELAAARWASIARATGSQLASGVVPRLADEAAVGTSHAALVSRLLAPAAPVTSVPAASGAVLEEADAATLQRPTLARLLDTACILTEEDIAAPGGAAPSDETGDDDDEASVPPSPLSTSRSTVGGVDGVPPTSLRLWKAEALLSRDWGRGRLAAARTLSRNGLVQRALTLAAEAAAVEAAAAEAVEAAAGGGGGGGGDARVVRRARSDGASVAPDDASIIEEEGYSDSDWESDAGGSATVSGGLRAAYLALEASGPAADTAVAVPATTDARHLTAAIESMAAAGEFRRAAAACADIARGTPLEASRLVTAAEALQEEVAATVLRGLGRVDTDSDSGGSDDDASSIGGASRTTVSTLRSAAAGSIGGRSAVSAARAAARASSYLELAGTLASELQQRAVSEAMTAQAAANEEAAALAAAVTGGGGDGDDGSMPVASHQLIVLPSTPVATPGRELSSTPVVVFAPYDAVGNASVRAAANRDFAYEDEWSVSGGGVGAIDASVAADAIAGEDADVDDMLLPAVEVSKRETAWKTMHSAFLEQRRVKREARREDKERRSDPTRRASGTPGVPAAPVRSSKVNYEAIAAAEEAANGEQEPTSETKGAAVAGVAALTPEPASKRKERVAGAAEESKPRKSLKKNTGMKPRSAPGGSAATEGESKASQLAGDADVHGRQQPAAGTPAPAPASKVGLASGKLIVPSNVGFRRDAIAVNAASRPSEEAKLAEDDEELEFESAGRGRSEAVEGDDGDGDFDYE